MSCHWTSPSQRLLALLDILQRRMPAPTSPRWCQRPNSPSFFASISRHPQCHWILRTRIYWKSYQHVPEADARRFGTFGTTANFPARAASTRCTTPPTSGTDRACGLRSAVATTRRHCIHDKYLATTNTSAACSKCTAAIASCLLVTNLKMERKKETPTRMRDGDTEYCLWRSNSKRGVPTPRSRQRTTTRELQRALS